MSHLCEGVPPCLEFICSADHIGGIDLDKLSTVFGMVTVMTASRLAPAGDRIIEPMIALAGCSTRHRIIVAGSKGIELTLELERRGYAHVASSANCGRPAGQHDVALIDWRQRPLRSLDTPLSWLLKFLSPEGVLVVWLDSSKPAVKEALYSALERHGLVVEASTVREDGSAFSARRRDMRPLSKAA